MPDQQHPPPQLPPIEAHSKNSPPLTPPDSNLNGSDHRQSRKREREVSLEPLNTPKISETDVVTVPESRDARTPAKRNRRTLESTEEEAEEGVGKTSSRSRSRSHSVSPPLGIGVSPRQEIRIKVRQISQGVEDLTWNAPKAFDKEQQGAEIAAPLALDPPAEVDEKTSAEQDAVITDVNEEYSQRPAQQEAAAGNDTTAGAEGGADPLSVSAVQAPVPQTHARSKSEGGEKGLKRRFEERGTSQGPNEGDNVSQRPSEPFKRPRDDESEDPNPRETKRPSPPPETQRTSPKPSPPSPKASAPKLTGFMAYASVSPFAAAKGPNVFSSGKNSHVSIFSSPMPSAPLSSFASTSSEASFSSQKNLTRSGFDAFASPFSSGSRSKSPVLGQTSKLGRAKSPPGRSNSVNSNPFASYIGNSQGFVIPAQKRARADSPPESSQSSLERTSTLDALEPDRTQPPEEEEEEEEEVKEKGASFGEILRATRDEDEDSNRSEDDPKVSLTEQQVITGEEEDFTIHQVRSKLFSLENGQWKERGTGTMRLNVKQMDGTGARLVMRKEAVYTLLLNVTLFHGMSCALAPQDPRYLRFSAIENGTTTHYNLRLGSAKAAQDLLNKVLSNIPPA